jgi:NADPH:quinone reductase-like Zn-dependent oxidoreductase
MQEIPRPVPAAGEVLVQVKAAAINPSDVKNISGHFSATLPRTPGRDFSGIVVEGKWTGEAVWGSGPGMGVVRDGAQAEYVAVPGEFIARKPSTLSMEQAAAIGVPYMTAWAALMRAAQIQEGETILIVGAAGAVGQAATQIANWKKVRVLGADRSSGRISGADATIDTQKEDMPARVRELTNGKGADVVLDAVGAAMFEPALRSLRRGGRQVVITSAGDKRVSFNLVDFYHNLSHLIGLDTQAFTRKEVSEISSELGAGFEAGALKIPPVETVPFADFAKAYENVAAGRSRAKQVLVIS